MHCAHAAAVDERAHAEREIGVRVGFHSSLRRSFVPLYQLRPAPPFVDRRLRWSYVVLVMNAKQNVVRSLYAMAAALKPFTEAASPGAMRWDGSEYTSINETPQD